MTSPILPPTVSGDVDGARFVSTDDVRSWRWGALLCTTAAFASRFRELTWKQISRKPVLLPFFGGGGNFEDYIDFYPVICLVRWIMSRLGKVGRETVKKSWLSVIINLKLAWLSVIITINDTSIGDLPLIVTISDTCKNQTKREIPKYFLFFNTQQEGLRTTTWYWRTIRAAGSRWRHESVSLVL